MRNIAGLASIIAAVTCFALPALAQTVPSLRADPFVDSGKGDKVHTASGFVCPERVGRYVRNSVGEGGSPADGKVFCSYYALDSVYGTVQLTPLSGPYDAKKSLAGDFVEQVGIGGKQVDEKMVTVKPADGAKEAESFKPVEVYTRTYETAHLESLRYQIKFTGAAINGWAVESIIEYASTRDDETAQNFLDFVYRSAETEVGKKQNAAPAK